MIELDTSARYAVRGYAGVAFRFAGFPQVWEPDVALVEDEDGNEVEVETDDGEWVDGPDDRVIVVMVGDDRRHEVARDDLTPLEDGAFCGGCGQVGCAWG